MELKHFYEVYKMLEDKKTEVHEIQGRQEAHGVIRRGIERYQKKYK